MSDETETEDTAPAPTVRSRAVSAGIDEERLRGHLERGVLLLDGEPVTDLDTPAPAGTRINVGGQ
ncbi:hypothetical protein [Pseudonocardia parietis]|uniref:Pseudouridine synthase n=1 Tax=Pseudonocardia parietis TaxID=570936 RepID=A0ABS4W6W4_9PSEU|nr:hypothetical protein [Pseudonocardia parietis]MBP2371364.1 hypothetical protein [Pseudonocardia parietis]